MTRPKVSVCIPVYNVSPFLERCVRSLMEQTLEDIEFIFVDDASTDSSAEILRAVVSGYPLRTDRVRILEHSRNLGVLQTRKDSLSQATGDYIIYCDADDWVEKDAYEKMYAASENGKADIIVAGYQIHLSGDIRTVSPRSCATPRECMRKWETLGFLWAQMIRRELVQAHIDDFSPVDFSEDCFITSHVFYHSHSIRFVPEALYHYNRENYGSLTWMTPKNIDPEKKDLILLNWRRVTDLYHQGSERFHFHKPIHHLRYLTKYMCRNAFESPWSFYFTFRSSSLFIPFYEEPGRTGAPKVKEFLVNNCFLLFLISQRKRFAGR